MVESSESPSVTIVMTSRERYSLTDQSIANVYRTTDHPFDFVYVDAGSPGHVRRAVLKLADEYGFKVVRTDRLVSPNHARNVGLRYATGKYVVFVDNDVDFREGWLEALVACAEEEAAAVVGPLYLQGPMNEETVHMAGGDMAFEGVWGARRFTQTQRHFLHKLGDVPPSELQRQECDIIEFHCALVRRDILEAAGWMDEGLLTTREHLDFCLRVQAVGEHVYFEPSSIMTYLTPPPFARSDLSYFLIRWSDTWTASTLKHFALKHGIDPSYAERVAKTRARRQHLVFSWLRPKLERRLGSALTAAVIRILRVVEPWYTRSLAAPALAKLTAEGSLGRISEYEGRQSAAAPRSVPDADVESYVRSLLQARIGEAAQRIALDEPFSEQGVPSIDVVAVLAAIERDHGAAALEGAELGEVARSCGDLVRYCLRLRRVATGSPR